MKRALITLLAVAAVLVTASPASAQPPPGGGGQGASRIAENVCNNIRQKLGDRFDTVFGSLAGCVEKLAPAAQAAFEACAGEHQPGSAGFQECAKARMEPEIKKYIGEGANPASNSGTAARAICANIQKKLGAERFEQRFGDVDKCVSEIEPKAKTALTKCSKEHKPRTDAHKACVSRAMKEHVAATGATKAAETIASNACRQAQKALGAERFEKQFGSVTGCVGKMLPRAQAAISKCSKKHEQGTKAYKQCVQGAMRARKK